MGVTEMGEGREKDDECPYVHFMGSDLCEKECERAQQNQSAVQETPS